MATKSIFNFFLFKLSLTIDSVVICIVAENIIKLLKTFCIVFRESFSEIPVWRETHQICMHASIPCSWNTSFSCVYADEM